MTVLDTHPFLTHSDGPTTKLIIGNVPISVANSEIELEGARCVPQVSFQGRNL